MREYTFKVATARPSFLLSKAFFIRKLPIKLKFSKTKVERSG